MGREFNVEERGQLLMAERNLKLAEIELNLAYGGMDRLLRLRGPESPYYGGFYWKGGVYFPFGERDSVSVANALSMQETVDAA